MEPTPAGTRSARRLPRAKRRAVRNAIAALRRQTRENGDPSARTYAARWRERQTAVSAVCAGNWRTRAPQAAPAKKQLAREYRDWCSTCQLNTTHRGEICQNHANKSCDTCSRLTLWKAGACSEHDNEYCSLCGRYTPHRSKKCLLSASHPKTETTSKWCDPCRQRTEHRNNTCQEHSKKYCEICRKNTDFRASECTEHTTGWCHDCGTNTPQKREFPYDCMAPNHGKSDSPAPTRTTSGETCNCAYCRSH